MPESIPEYTTLVMSGGGIKGIGLLGALQYLADKNRLNSIHKFIGTSIGAIVGYLIAIGYTPIEIMVMVNQKCIIEQMLHSFNMVDLIHYGGAVNFCLVQEFLEESTIQKVGHLLTLKQLHEEFGKHLICSTYNYDQKECEYLDYVNSPNLPCITALRMSSNLPFLFHPFTYEGSLYYDGAMLDNFPVSQLKEDDVAIAIRLAQARGNEKEKEDENHRQQRRKYPWMSGRASSFDFMTYVFEIMHIPMESVYKLSFLNSKYKPRDTVHLLLQFPSFRWGISMTDKFNSFSIGYETMRKYFQVSFIIPYVNTNTDV